MGCIHNSTVRNLNSRASFHLTNSNCEFFSKHSDLLKYKKDFDRLQLDEYALERLFTSFVKIDQDLSGEISTWELLEFLHLEVSGRSILAMDFAKWQMATFITKITHSMRLRFARRSGQSLPRGYFEYSTRMVQGKLTFASL